jgi:hypothetical protein
VTYSATAHTLLISAPGDVPVDDTEKVMRTIARWNVIYGRQLGAVVVPMHWDLHSAAEHGVRPQAVINTQLVKDTDILIAIFWHRLGSHTGEAESGTVEEIDEAQANGAYVAILRCARDVDPRSVDSEQAERLSAFLDSIKAESLMLWYEDDAELAQRVDAILTQAVTRSATRTEAATETPRVQAEVWPRVEGSDRLSGSGRTRRVWRLILSNVGAEPARRVRFRLEPESPGEHAPRVLETRELEVLAPGGEAGFPLMVAMGMSSQARCVVEWEDSAGEHENVATVRI